jgi:replicative DNA helicase
MRKRDAEAFDVLQKRAENGGSVTGLPTGYTEFDEMTAGPAAHRPDHPGRASGDGQDHVRAEHRRVRAIKSKKAVAVFSMEMSASQLALRLISSLGRVNATRLRTGQLEDEDWSRVTGAIRK